MNKTTLGKLPADAFGMLELPPLPTVLSKAFARSAISPAWHRTPWTSSASVSNMGGMSASIGHRQGQLGAIVDGAVRDIDHGRDIGYPIWSRSVSPITGKWRVKTVAVNKPVDVCGITVNPGDLVLADETGVCFVPRTRAAEVLARVQAIAENEVARQAKIDGGAPVAELLPKKNRSRSCCRRRKWRVGWVERSETHRSAASPLDGFR